MSYFKTGIIGAGAIGTALGNAIASRKDMELILVSIEEAVVKDINTNHINSKYFPYINLNPNLQATTDTKELANADYIFLATPSAATLTYLLKIQNDINPNAILINMAKGFGDNTKTITELIQEKLPNPAGSFKGPTFARELIENSPTAFTFACKEEKWFEPINKIFEGSPISIDFSTDLIGVELMSILKNIYAIVIGIIDARFSSPNLRFMVLTRAFKEMRNILRQFGGKDETLFNYCGLGDFTLTSLNDLSRNRTLGLFMGKGFFTRDISEKVLLEGKLATEIFCEKISQNNSITDYHIISELYKVFTLEQSTTEFVDKILKD
jgi:glycerol-3-phosphate dehydrogenase (NAD(P)+)